MAEMRAAMGLSAEQDCCELAGMGAMQESGIGNRKDIFLSWSESE
jgi:hypothetical protein